MPRRKSCGKNLKQFKKSSEPQASEISDSQKENVDEEATAVALLEFTFSPPNYQWQKMWCENFGISNPSIVEYSGTGNVLGSNIIVISIKGDGNCFFRCISFALTGSEEHHEKMRTLIVDHLLQNREAAIEKFEFSRDLDPRTPEYKVLRQIAFDSHLAVMAVPGSDRDHWATMLEVIGAASLLQTDICMYQNLDGSEDAEPQFGWQRYSWLLLRPTSDHQPVASPGAIYMKNTQNIHYVLVVGNTELSQSSSSFRDSQAKLPDVSPRESIERTSNTCLSCGKTFVRLNAHLSKNSQCKHVHENLVKENEAADEKRKSYKRKKQNEYISQETAEKRAKRLSLHSEYNNKNQDTILKKQHQYNKSHCERIRENQANYDSTHREQVNEKQANYNYTHREQVNENQANYNSAHREQVRENQANYNDAHRQQICEKKAMRVKRQKESTSEQDRLKQFMKGIKFGPIFPCSICHRCLYQVGVKKVTDRLKEKMNRDGIFDQCFYPLPREEQYICHTCFNHLSKGKMPPMAVENGLGLDPIPEELQLSELGQVLIAKSILFFKLLKLPKSRWSAVRDKTVHVPISDDSILNTLSNLNSLPRLPDEAGLIPVKLKRKVEYKNYVLEAYIDPAKLVEAVRILKQLGHPGYQRIEIRDYSHELISDNERLRDDNTGDGNVHTPQNANDLDGVNAVGGDGEADDDTDDEVDNIRRYQCDDLSTVMSNDHPEVHLNIPHTDNSTNNLSIAPGQGKMPTNLMRESDWDVNSFPHLHPTGKYGLKFSRAIHLAPWKYFCQRLYNVDKRFSSSNPYVFASLYYLERHAIEQQISVSYLKGNVSSSGELTNVEDAFAVLNQLPGSPRYWKKQRNIMFAKLENLGPFLFFYTLSCADKRWTENFTSIYELQNKKVTYLIENGIENVYVDGELLTDVLERENRHELLCGNIDIVARNFNQRVRAFVKNIMMGANSPMHTEFYNHRIEFQARGAGHVHGVAWPKFDQLELDFPAITVAIETLRKNERLPENEKEAVTNLVDAFISCSLDTDLQNIVKEVQVHNHSKTCRKYGTNCRFGFPRFPSERTIIAQPLRPADFSSEFDFETEKSKHKKVLGAVKDVLQNLEKNNQLEVTTIDELLNMSEVSSEDYHKALEVSEKGTTIILHRKVCEVYVNNYNTEWLRAWNGNMDLQVCLDYYAVLTYITDYYMKDDSGTMQFLIDAAKEYAGTNITDKMKYLANVFLTHRQKGKFEAFYCIDPSLHLTDSNIKSVFVDTNLPENRRTFLMKVGDDCDESTNDDDPAMYPHNEDDDCRNENEHVTGTGMNIKTLTIPGKSGKYVQRSSSLHEKYERRPAGLRNLCFAQFCTVFETCQANSVKNKTFVNGMFGTSEKVIANSDASVREFLPGMIQLRHGIYMRLRNKPCILRQYKPKEDKQPHQFSYGEILLYVPWYKEEECCPHNFEECYRLFQSKLPQIELVKSILFPHRNNVEAGQAFIESMGDYRANHIGDTLDAANEQEQEELRAQGEEIDESTIFRNPEGVVDGNYEAAAAADMGSMYRRIDVSDKDEMRRNVRKLDPDQRYVFDQMVHYFKDIRKAAKKGDRVRNPPFLVVHGGAGTGKSELIRVIAQWCEATLRSDDDRNPDQPFIILAAPTGTAASNIKGLTMHTAFSLPFSNKFMCLSDKKRDAVRTLLARLKLVVIDEMSMIKSDQLYQLNLRLQEIMGNTMDFGGVSVLMFGDLLQLRPVSAKYIFEEPKNDNFRLSRECRNLWNIFSKVELRHNHRQGDHRNYAEALGRIRFGQKESHDMEMLRMRVTDDVPIDAIHLFGTNAEVNSFNDDRLEEMEGTEWIICAINLHPTLRDYTPRIGKDRSVNETPFQSVLKLKIGARVMVTFNIEVKDRIVNGAIGMVEQIKGTTVGDNAQEILVRFDDPEVGEMTRRSQRRTDGLTSITKMSYEYSIRGRADSVTHAKVIQFPLKLAWGLTVHKFQGQTVVAPTKLVGHMENIKQKSQAYVLFGRVQSVNQLYLTSFDADKMIKVDDGALKEAQSFQTDAVNLIIRPWRDSTVDRFKIAHLNVRSLRKHFEDVSTDAELLSAQCICLTETWLESSDVADGLQLEGYTLFLCNAGRGKGVAVYTKMGPALSTENLCQANVQIVKVSYEALDLICCYRSPRGRPVHFVQSLHRMIDPVRKAVICGDLNLDVSNRLIVDMMNDARLQQLVKEPTHIEGNTLDHIYTNINDSEYHLHSAYYSDHDITCVEFKID